MRQITKDSVRAFINGNKFNRQNMAVMGDSENTILTLHGNVIATKEGNKYLLTDSGWQTVTTKERLNGVLAELNSEWRIYQMDYIWYITNGMGVRKEWTGTLEVKD